MGLLKEQRLYSIRRELVKFGITSNLYTLVLDVPTMPVPIDVDRLHEFQAAIDEWFSQRDEEGYYYYTSNPLQKNHEYANKRRYQFYFTGTDLTEDLRNFCFEARLRYM